MNWEITGMQVISLFQGWVQHAHVHPKVSLPTGSLKSNFFLLHLLKVTVTSPSLRTTLKIFSIGTPSWRIAETGAMPLHLSHALCLNESLPRVWYSRFWLWWRRGWWEVYLDCSNFPTIIFLSEARRSYIYMKSRVDQSPSIYFRLDKILRRLGGTRWTRPARTRSFNCTISPDSVDSFCDRYISKPLHIVP